MSEPEHARLLFAMARKDLAALAGMSDGEVFADEIFGFHAQQAVEKTLKAWLSLLGMEYPKTHDLRLLCALLEEVTDRTAPWELVTLHVFAVQFRHTTYEDAGVALDRVAIRSAVSRLVDQVAGLLADE